MRKNFKIYGIFRLINNGVCIKIRDQTDRFCDTLILMWGSLFERALNYRLLSFPSQHYPSHFHFLSQIKEDDCNHQIQVIFMGRNSFEMEWEWKWWEREREKESDTMSESSEREWHDKNENDDVRSRQKLSTLSLSLQLSSLQFYSFSVGSSGIHPVSIRCQSEG